MPPFDAEKRPRPRGVQRMSEGHGQSAESVLASNQSGAVAMHMAVGDGAARCNVFTLGAIWILVVHLLS